jgi:hypothetical protein
MQRVITQTHRKHQHGEPSLPGDVDRIRDLLRTAQNLTTVGIAMRGQIAYPVETQRPGQQGVAHEQLPQADPVREHQRTDHGEIEKAQGFHDQQMPFVPLRETLAVVGIGNRRRSRRQHPFAKPAIQMRQRSQHTEADDHE